MTSGKTQTVNCCRPDMIWSSCFASGVIMPIGFTFTPTMEPAGTICTIPWKVPRGEALSLRISRFTIIRLRWTGILVIDTPWVKNYSKLLLWSLRQACSPWTKSKDAFLLNACRIYGGVFCCFCFHFIWTDVLHYYEILLKSKLDFYSPWTAKKIDNRLIWCTIHF